MSKHIEYGAEAIKKMLKGAAALAKAVGTTLGPKGRLAVIQSGYGAPKITKDGVTVAKAIEIDEPVENIGAELVRLASSKTVDDAGDGTTTATIIANELIQGMAGACQNRGVNQSDVRKGMENARDVIIKYLKSCSVQIAGNYESIAHVGSISANGDAEIGKLLADAMKEIGDDGVITVENGKGLETEIAIVKGMQLDRGYLSSYFSTNQETMVCELENPYILIYEKKVSTIQSIVPLLEQVVKSGRPLLIIAEDVDGEALATLTVNKIRGTLKVCAIKAPAFGDRRKSVMDDISVLTAGKFISDEIGMKLENVTLNELGSADRVIITKDTTTIVGGSGAQTDIQHRCASIKKQMIESESDYDTEKLRERLAKLASGVAVIKVGGATETEVKEKRDRIDDALHATRAAVAEGIVPGGGVALLRCVSLLDNLIKESSSEDIKIGLRIVRDAISWPAKIIAENAGVSGDVVIQEILKSSDPEYGYDARNAKFCNMISSGIIDPCKVVISIIVNAISAASTVTGTGVVIYEKKDKPSGVHREMPDMGMGGF